MTQPYHFNRIVAVFAGAVLLCLGSPWASAAKSITQYGITWTFDQDYPTGQFANGDYWVVGPVRIISITPRSTTKGSRTINGSMVNPAVGDPQGYDSATYAGYARDGWNPKLNVALDVSEQKPLTLKPGSSLISTISEPKAGVTPQLKAAAILTVLEKPAPAGSFRPPYVGKDKTIRYTTSQLDWSILRNLRRPAHSPDIRKLAGRFERPWLEQNTRWRGRFLHPTDNQPDYGREIANLLAEGLLALHLDYPQAHKEPLFIRLVQYGIDIHGVAKNGGVWVDDGGHNPGRKMPLLLAGLALKDQDILRMADGKRHRIFQEDRQTWYVTLADVGRPLLTSDKRPRVRYLLSDIGVPEWGEKHTSSPERDGRNWNAYYRDIAGHCALGHALTARLMGAEKYWNWPAFFDYTDRYWEKERKSRTGGGNAIRPFVHAMWSAYRGGTPSNFTPETTATESWNSVSIPLQTGNFTLTFDVVPSVNRMEGVAGVSRGAPKQETDLAAALRLSRDGLIEARNGDTYQAAARLPYSAGKKYRVVMNVDVARRTYVARVTPAGGSTVTIANHYRFGSRQASITSLDRVGFFADGGAHAVLNLDVSASAPASTTAPASGGSASSPPPSSGGTRVQLDATSTNSGWQGVSIPRQKGLFEVSFQLTPLRASVNTVTGLSVQQAKRHGDLAASIRMTPEGYFTAANRTGFTSVNRLKYQANQTYAVRMTVDVRKRVYSATITPPGGRPVVIADNYPFRTEQASATSLGALSLIAVSGQHRVHQLVVHD